MPSKYLDPTDYVTYGVPNATAAEVTNASAIIDGYLDRPDGLIYIVDVGDNPIAMALTNQPITFNGVLPFHRTLYLSNTPLVAVLNVKYNTTPGVPPTFKTVTDSGFTPDGHFWPASNIPGRSEIVIQYIAGWLYTNLPSAIKQACANIIKLLEEDVISSSVSKRRAGDTEIDYAKPLSGNIFIDNATASMLAPYKRVFA